MLLDNPGLHKDIIMLKKTLLAAAALTTTLLAQENGAQLLKNKCASCHMLKTPQFFDLQKLTAPAMDAVVFHVKLAKEKPEEQKAFIVDYVLNPDISKSVCESNKVAKYGMMPSQKGKVSKKELEEIANYMLAEYPRDSFTAMIKEMQANDKISALSNSPFLINSESLPHLTKLLVLNWDKGGLGLSKEQKKKLLKVRKETMQAVKRIKMELKPLTDEVSEAMVDREDPKSVEEQLKKIAALKLEATRVHLKCIADTTAILSDEQVAYLLPFWQ